MIGFFVCEMEIISDNGITLIGFFNGNTCMWSFNFGIGSSCYISSVAKFSTVHPRLHSSDIMLLTALFAVLSLSSSLTFLLFLFDFNHVYNDKRKNSVRLSFFRIWLLPLFNWSQFLTFYRLF